MSLVVGGKAVEHGGSSGMGLRAQGEAHGVVDEARAWTEATNWRRGLTGVFWLRWHWRGLPELGMMVEVCGCANETKGEEGVAGLGFIGGECGGDRSSARMGAMRGRLGTLGAVGRRASGTVAAWERSCLTGASGASWHEELRRGGMSNERRFESGRRSIAGVTWR